MVVVAQASPVCGLCLAWSMHGSAGVGICSMATVGAPASPADPSASTRKQPEDTIEEHSQLVTPKRVEGQTIRGTRDLSRRRPAWSCRRLTQPTINSATKPPQTMPAITTPQTIFPPTKSASTTTPSTPNHLVAWSARGGSAQEAVFLARLVRSESSSPRSPGADSGCAP